MSTKAELESRILTLELALSVLQKELEKVRKKANNPITPIGVKPNPFPYEPWINPGPRWDGGMQVTCRDESTYSGYSGLD